jgi:hypothetical protein
LQKEEEEEEEIREWGKMTNKSHGPQVITKQQLYKYQAKFFFQQHSDSLFHYSKREPKESQAALLSFLW